MLKKMIISLLLTVSVYAYNNVSNVVVVNGGKYVKVTVKCDGGECEVLDKDRVKLHTIAKLKSVKSWARLFKSGKDLKILGIERISNKECVITYIICNSYDSKVYDSSFGIDILYKDN